MMELDDAYANAPYIPNSSDYPPRWAAAAEQFRSDMTSAGRAELAVPYGPTERQAFDLFQPEGTAKGLFIFVHGGYWIRFHRNDWSHFAQGALDRGWAVAMPSYDLCPDVRIADITRQVSKAVSTIATRVDGPIRMAGHSAGGHLVSRVTASGLLPSEVQGRIEHVVPISPVTDLRPLLKTSMNEQFRMTEDDAVAESPALQNAPICPVTVWVGADERPVFLDQARWLSEGWEAPLVIHPARHHFDIIDGLADARSPLASMIFMET